MQRSASNSMLALGVLVALLDVGAVESQQPLEPLFGQVGSAEGPTWQSSWLDLSVVTDFDVGDRIRLQISGEARRVLIRLVPRGAPETQPVGVVGGVVSVPPTGVVELTLSEAHRGVVQVAVHGGREAWETLLNENGGQALLQSVARMRSR